jgi:hypothetical protein
MPLANLIASSSAQKCNEEKTRPPLQQAGKGMVPRDSLTVRSPTDCGDMEVAGGTGLRPRGQSHDATRTAVRPGFSSREVAASSAPIQSRTPWWPLAAPKTILPLMGIASGRGRKHRRRRNPSSCCRRRLASSSFTRRSAPPRRKPRRFRAACGSIRGPSATIRPPHAF